MNILLGLAAAFLAYFVKGLAGFANTLVFSSIVSFQAPNRITAPVDLLLGFPANLYMAWRERQSISLKIVLPLVVLIYAGMIPGAFFLKLGNEQLLKIILGIAIVLLGIEMALRESALQKHGPKKSNPLLLSLIGLGSGILCGLFGVGAFLAAYISRTTTNQSQFRANFCCVFLLENLFRIGLYLYAGLLTMESLTTALWLIPAVIGGMTVGIWASGKIPEKRAKNIVIILLILSGISLAWTNLMLLI